MVYRELDKQALKENGYTVLSKITLLNDNSVFTEDDFIVDWNYEDYRYVPNKGFIGEFVERILDGNLQNIPDNKIFENQEINLQLGIVNGIDNTTTWYDYGNFLITKVEKTDTTGRYKFESADYTKKFNKEYEDTIHYPCLAMELANNVCEQAEVTLDIVNTCHIYIVDENGLEAGNYNFKIENNYYNFTLNNDLEKNDVLYFTRAYNALTLKKVRFTQQDGYVVTRNTISYTTSTTTITGTTLNMRSVPFINFTNNDFVIENNQYDEKDTLRKVMQDIGKLAYSWVRIGEDNKVHIDYEQDASIDNYDKLSTNEYYVSKKADLYFGPVNKVVLGMSNIEGESLYKTSSTYTEDTECAIKIYDNNLTYTEELRAIALNGCERLFGIEYMPLEIETIGHPWLNGNEMIELTNVDGEVLRTYPFNRRIKYAGYIEGVISSEAETKQNNEYEYESEIVKQINKTSITVDKNNQTITSLVSNVNAAQNNISELYQTTNEISATVDHLDKEYETNVVIRRDAEGNPIEVENAGPYALESFRIYGNAVQEITEEEAGTTIQINGSATLTDVDTSKESRVLRLLGQTSQTGTPTPDAPIDINVVSGDNTIDICGKNLCPDNFTNGVFNNNTGLIQSHDNNHISYENYIKVLPSTQYYIKHNHNFSGTGSTSIFEYDKDKNFIQRLGFVGTNSTAFTTNSETTYINISVFDNGGASLSGFECQIEKGSTATTYEPYIGHSYPIYLGVENLYEGSQDFSGTWVNSGSWVTDTQTYNDLVVKKRIGMWEGTYKEIQVKSGNTYTFSLFVKSDVSRQATIYLSGGTATISPSNKSINTTTNWEKYSITFDCTASGTIRPRIENTTSVSNDYTYICGYQLEVGSKANSFSPYGTTPIELCKIGTYQDKIYKGGGYNLFDGSSVGTPGQYINSSGNIATGGTDLRYTDYISVEASKGNLTISGMISTLSAPAICFYNSNKEFISGQGLGGVETLTVSIPSNASYFRCSYRTSNTQTMIEYGTNATSYEPYGAKDEWLLHKEIGKVVLDGSENWSIAAWGENPFKRCTLVINDLITTIPDNQVSPLYCTHFKECSYSTGTKLNYMSYRYNTPQLNLWQNVAINSVAEWKTWLAENNVTLYYVLATPTAELITDETLLAQLDDLESS